MGSVEGLASAAGTDSWATGRVGRSDDCSQHIHGLTCSSKHNESLLERRHRVCVRRVVPLGGSRGMNMAIAAEDPLQGCDVPAYVHSARSMPNTHRPRTGGDSDCLLTGTAYIARRGSIARQRRSVACLLLSLSRLTRYDARIDTSCGVRLLIHPSRMTNSSIGSSNDRACGPQALDVSLLHSLGGLGGRCGLR
ncbi:hypothetical protein VNO80_33235 [Phaseolus coccineus]|uniref:Uncharacterized protein n=1 Tax=Phaseolus coccineus TaxID=3886 RepID=A0AAN9KYF2_PHACN